MGSGKDQIGVVLPPVLAGLLPRTGDPEDEAAINASAAALDAIARAANPHETFLRIVNGSWESTRANPSTLYLAWSRFEDTYLTYVERLRAASEAALAKEKPDAADIEAVLAAARRTEIVMKRVESFFRNFNPALISDSWEWQIIRSHRARISNFRVPVMSFISAFQPNSPLKGLALEYIPDIVGTIKQLRDPFNWIETVVAPYVEDAKIMSELTLPKPRPVLVADRPRLIWELIDRIYMAVPFDTQGARIQQRPLDLAFSWNEGVFSIELPWGVIEHWGFINVVMEHLGGSREITGGNGSTTVRLRFPLAVERETNATARDRSASTAGRRRFPHRGHTRRLLGTSRFRMPQSFCRKI